MKGWNYATLSHMAKEAGGPEKFVEGIAEMNYKQGYQDATKELLNQVESIVTRFLLTKNK